MKYQLTSKENLNAAYLQVYRNKGASGVDGKSVQTLKSTLQANGKQTESNSSNK